MYIDTLTTFTTTVKTLQGMNGKSPNMFLFPKLTKMPENVLGKTRSCFNSLHV